MFASSLLPPLLNAKAGRRGVFRSRSLGGAASLARCSNFSVRRRHHPSLPPSVLPSSSVRSSTPSIFHPPSPCHSMRVPCLFCGGRGTEGGRGSALLWRRRRCSRRPPGRRRLPSSFFLNTERDRAPSDQVRSRCSLVCSLGWMDGWMEHGRNKWSPLARSLARMHARSLFFFLLLLPCRESRLLALCLLALCLLAFRAPAATLPAACWCVVVPQAESVAWSVNDVELRATYDREQRCLCPPTQRLPKYEERAWSPWVAVPWWSWSRPWRTLI